MSITVELVSIEHSLLNSADRIIKLRLQWMQHMSLTSMMSTDVAVETTGRVQDPISSSLILPDVMMTG